MADTCPSVPNEPHEPRPSHPHPHLCTEVELSEDYLRDNKQATKKPKKGVAFGGTRTHANKVDYDLNVAP